MTTKKKTIKKELTWEQKALCNKNYRGEHAYLMGIDDYKQAVASKIESIKSKCIDGIVTMNASDLISLLADVKPLKK